MNGQLDIVLRLAFDKIDKPYIWGGDDGIAGWDCSGLVIELLQSVGLLPHNFDTTALGLYKYFIGKFTNIPSAGCLAFWGKSVDKIIHTELCFNHYLTIGASGGGSKTLTKEDAIKHNAYVKMRPLYDNARRTNPVALVNPFI